MVKLTYQLTKAVMLVALHRPVNHVIVHLLMKRRNITAGHVVAASVMSVRQIRDQYQKEAGELSKYEYVIIVMVKIWDNSLLSSQH